MTAAFSNRVKITSVEQITPLIKHFKFERLDGEPFLPYSSGSHVVVSMKNDTESHKNPYSLVGSSNNYRQYQIAVRLEDNGRGGSKFMHTQVEVGTELEIGNPYNLFPVYKIARKHLMIAGGVGITPFMTYIDEMDMTKGKFELHYATRDKNHAAFAKELLERHPESIKLYHDDQGPKLNIEALLSDQPLGTHVYVCGPKGMVDAVLKIADALCWPDTAIHSEEFKAPETGKPFTVRLNKSQRDIQVSEKETLLEALEKAELEIPYSCRGGACGFCKTDVVEGDIDHRDYFLSDEEKASGKCMMPCISRVKGNNLVLDL